MNDEFLTKEEVEAQKKKRKKKIITWTVLSVIALFLIGSIIASFRIYNGIFEVKNPIEPGTYDSSFWNDYKDSLRRFPREFEVYGQKIQGYLYTTQEDVEDKGIIIVVNGMSCTPEAHMPEIKTFCKEGYRVLNLSGMGTGYTGGDSEVGLCEQKAILNEVLYHLPEDENVFLYGHSAGAYAVATECNDPRIQGTVAMAGFRSPMKLMMKAAKQKVGVLAYPGAPFLTFVHFFTFGTDGFEDPKKALEQVETPVLILHGDHDEVISEELSIYALKDEITNENVEFSMIHAGHNDISEDGDTMKKIIDFFNEAGKKDETDGN